MAEIDLTSGVRDSSGGIVFTWEGLADGDTGQPANVRGLTGFTAQVIGDATTVAIEGSNDGTNFFPLEDKTGTTIALAGATSDMALIQEHPLYLRPAATGGADTNVIIYALPVQR